MATLEKLPFRTVVTVPEGERALVLRDGRFEALLRPGRHTFTGWRRELQIEAHSLLQPAFASSYEAALVRERKDLASAHLTEVTTGPTEIAVILRDGKLYGVQRPDLRTYFWTDAGPWAVQRIDVSQGLDIDPALLQRLLRINVSDRVKVFNVEEGQVGLLSIDNAFVRTLTPGQHGFWNVGRPISVRVIDIRQNSLDVSGQEVLTRDRVTIRINVAAEYRVVDPVKAVSSVKDFADALYRSLQYAFRKSLGSKSLDEILAKKVSVDEEVAKAVRSEMAAIGIAVGEIAIKDVILPGEIRDILNRVVQAEKEAEANVIRRREETSATRSLLNTARVMEENPIMLRLKELEALEKISEKVHTLTVHSGTQGLLDDLVNLRTPKPGEAEPRPRPAKK